MLIYRVERKDRPSVGPFTCSHAAEHAADQARREGVFVPHNHEPPLLINSVQNCGFPSLAVYRQWFQTPGVRKALYDEGTCHMRVYDVPGTLVIHDRLQVLFQIAHATSVRVATPEEYL
jgi:hypothetical protein